MIKLKSLLFERNDFHEPIYKMDVNKFFEMVKKLPSSKLRKLQQEIKDHIKYYNNQSSILEGDIKKTYRGMVQNLREKLNLVNQKLIK